MENQKNIQHLVNFQPANSGREVVGTLLEFAQLAKVTSLALYGPNLANLNKRVIIIMKRVDGLTDSIVCSPKVSELIRNKEVTLNQIKSFPVVESISEEGEVFAQVQMPSNGIDAEQVLEFKLTNEVEEYQPKAKAYDFDPSTLIAW